MDAIIDYNEYCQQAEKFEKETGLKPPRNKQEHIEAFNEWHSRLLQWMKDRADNT